MSSAPRPYCVTLGCLAALALFSLSGCGGFGPSVFWSPDSRSLALDLDGRLRLFNVQRGEFATVDTADCRVANPTFSPDGTRLAYQAVTEARGGSAADLRVRDLRTNREWTVETEIASEAYRPGDSDTSSEHLLQSLKARPPAWSPDGCAIAFSIRSGDDWIIAIAPPRPVRAAERTRVLRLSKNGDGPQHHPSWSPDGTRIALFCGERDPSLRVCDLDGRDVFSLRGGRGVRGQLCDFTAPVWSTDGSRVIVLAAAEGSSGEVKAWAVPTAGGRAELLGACTTPLASASADLVARAYLGGRDDRSVVYRAGSLSRILDQIPEQSAGFPVLSPSGKELALPIHNPALNRDELRVYDVTTGRALICPIDDGVLVAGTGAAAQSRLQRITELPPESPWRSPLPWALTGLALTFAAIAARLFARASAQRGA